MLRLQKGRSYGKVTFHVQSREKLFTQIFLGALFLAFLVHVVSFLIFDLQMPEQREVKIDYNKILVYADPSGLNVKKPKAAALIQDAFLDNYIILPRNKIPEIPPLPKEPIEKGEALVSNLSLIPETADEFRQIEQPESIFPLANFSIPLYYKPIKIKFLGELASYANNLTALNFLHRTRLKMGSNSITSIMLELHIDGKTGEVFEVEVLSSEKASKVNELALRIAQKIKLEPGNLPPFLKGIIEISFETPENENLLKVRLDD